MKRFLCPVVVWLLTSLPFQAEPAAALRFSLENMDRTVAPGTDFYRYANGLWLQKSSIPEDQVTWSPTTALTERNLALLHELLKSLAVEKPERSVRERQVGDFFAAAMGEARIEELGVQPIAADLAKIGALAAKMELPALLADFHERGIGGMFSDSVEADARKSDVYAYSLSQGGLGLPDRDYYFGPQFARERAGYQAHQLRMHTLLGTPAEAAARQVKAVVAIEQALAKGSRKLEDTSDPILNYHKKTLKELQALTPSFDWTVYLEHAHAAPLETVIIGQPEFFQALEKALVAFPLDDWKAYLRWHVVTGAAPLLHEALAAESFAFYGTVLNGQPKIDPRWKRSIRRVDGALGEALGQLYVDRYFPADAQERMAAMVKNMEAVYRDRLEKVPWMQPATRLEATKKFARFTAKLGAPAKPRITPRSRSSATTSSATSSARTSSNRVATWRASASRSTAPSGA